jgi:hypothetical protein
MPCAVITWECRDNGKPTPHTPVKQIFYVNCSEQLLFKNDVFWDVTLLGSCKSRRFGGMYCLHHEGDKNR